MLLNLQSGEEDRDYDDDDDDKDNAYERKEASLRIKKNYSIGNIIGDINEGITTRRKKVNYRHVTTQKIPRAFARLK